MENLGKQTGMTDASITNTIKEMEEKKEMEERMSESEDTIEEIDSLVKENVKSNKLLTQNISEI